MSEVDSQMFEDDGHQEEGGEVSPADVRLAAMNFLARREHSMLELKQKLRRRFSDEDLLDSELQRLAAESLQSDVRYAESFILQRASRGYGFNRVRQELREKGLTDSEVSCAIESTAIDWSSVALEVYFKKFGENGTVDLKEKAKRIRFMEYRGFDREHYRQLLD